MVGPPIAFDSARIIFQARNAIHHHLLPCFRCRSKLPPPTEGGGINSHPKELAHPILHVHCRHGLLRHTTGTRNNASMLAFIWWSGVASKAGLEQASLAFEGSSPLKFHFRPLILPPFHPTHYTTDHSVPTRTQPTTHSKVCHLVHAVGGPLRSQTKKRRRNTRTLPTPQSSSFPSTTPPPSCPLVATPTPY